MKDLITGVVKDQTNDLLKKARRKSSKIIDDKNLSEMFGIDIEEIPPPDKKKIKSKKKPVKRPTIKTKKSPARKLKKPEDKKKAGPRKKPQKIKGKSELR